MYPIHSNTHQLEYVLVNTYFFVWIKFQGHSVKVFIEFCVRLLRVLFKISYNFTPSAYINSQFYFSREYSHIDYYILMIILDPNKLIICIWCATIKRPATKSWVARNSTLVDGICINLKPTNKNYNENGWHIKMLECEHIASFSH